MNKIKVSLFFVLLLIFPMILSGCVSYNHLTQYTISQGDNFVNYYVFNESKIHKEDLIVFIGGSGYSSELGLKEHGIWKKTTLVYELHCDLLSTFDILVPEKQNMIMGGDHSEETKILQDYTMEQRVSAAALVIDNYLLQNSYRHIILIGFSEGGYVLPKIYFSLKQKDKISGLVLLASGGLSQLDCFRILKDKPYPFPEGYKNGLDIIEEVVEDIKSYPDSINKRYLGLPYKRWSSFMFYRPLDDLMEIEIPIFVGHGERDMMSPIDSSRQIRIEYDKMYKDNLTFIEYSDQYHGFNGEFDNIIKDINNWFLEKVK